MQKHIFLPILCKKCTFMLKLFVMLCFRYAPSHNFLVHSSQFLLCPVTWVTTFLFVNNQILGRLHLEVQAETGDDKVYYFCYSYDADRMQWYQFISGTTISTKKQEFLRKCQAFKKYIFMFLYLILVKYFKVPILENAPISDLLLISYQI